MYGRPEVQFLSETQIFSLSYAHDIMIASFLDIIVTPRVPWPSIRIGF